MGIVAVVEVTYCLLPPLVKGRTVRGTVRCNPGEATINHGGQAKRGRKGGYVAGSDIVAKGELRQERCNRRWDVSLLIRSDTTSLYVSTPQSRLRRASPPWQGGPRGLSNFATKCNLLPLLQEEAKEAVRHFNNSNYPHKIQYSST